MSNQKAQVANSKSYLSTENSMQELSTNAKIAKVQTELKDYYQGKEEIGQMLNDFISTNSRLKQLQNETTESLKRAQGSNLQSLEMNKHQQITANEAAIQQHIRIAQEKVNALLRQKLSLDMTLNELKSLNVDENQLKPIAENIASITNEISEAAQSLANLVINLENA